MDAADRDWKERFAELPHRGKTEACPRTETVSTWARGALPEEGLAHLADCIACREELVALRRLLAEKSATESPRLAVRSRLYAVFPERRTRFLWIAGAAAVVLIAVAAALFSGGGQTPAPPKPLAAPPRTKPVTMPAPEPHPEASRGIPTPEKPVALPPAAEKPPPAPLPEPPKDPPVVVVVPPPAPEKAAPLPDKPAPAPTRARLRGSLLSVSGSVATQLDSDSWQPLRVAQGRDFMGSVKVKAEAAAGKFRVGVHTCYLQRGGELSLALEEGRTQVRLARGEAFFDVTPGREPFEVETPQGVVRVKGTRFLVALDRAETEVAVQRGAVQFNAVSLGAGERSSGGPPQKADLSKRLAWVRALEDTIRIEAEQMALSGGMVALPDATASGGRAIGLKDAPKAGQEAVAEIAAKRKQPATYAVWIRLHWAHNVPSALTLAVGDALSWSSKSVTASPTWQWIRAGSAELPEGTFRVRLSDSQPGMRIDQILITSDLELNPEQDKK
jgi:ferric-dicitrate binding protein FerR (iron transport regulator)